RSAFILPAAAALHVPESNCSQAWWGGARRCTINPSYPGRPYSGRSRSRREFLRLRWVAGKKRARSGSGIRGALRPIRSRAAALQPITALCAPVARVGKENRVLGFAFTKRIRVFVRHLSALPHECSKGAKRLKAKSVVEAHGARIQIGHGERHFPVSLVRQAAESEIHHGGAQAPSLEF